MSAVFCLKYVSVYIYLNLIELAHAEQQNHVHLS